MPPRLLPFSLLLPLLTPSVSLGTESTSTQRSGVIGAGEDWETSYHLVDSAVAGPTVLLIAGMHGNEPAGSRAADQIRHWPLVRGKLIVIPRANVLALAANTRLTPNETGATSNLNRNFPPTDPSTPSRVTPRGDLAAALWAFAMKTRPDWVIDLHEGFDFNISHQPSMGQSKSVGSSLIYRGGPTLDPVAEKVIAAVNATVTDPKKRFTLLKKGPVSTGLSRACINVMGAEAMILETTYRNQPLSLRARQHRIMVNVLLRHISLIDRDCQDILINPNVVSYSSITEATPKAGYDVSLRVR
ncbi:MAG: succinylglutamate desuccinylase/aspartoacylase family protein [Verrucomicrobiota bacterium]